MIVGPACGRGRQRIKVIECVHEVTNPIVRVGPLVRRWMGTDNCARMENDVIGEWP